MLRCIQEAREFIRLAEAVPTHDTLVTKDDVTRKVRYIESGKASGLMKAQSIILTRALADLRQGR